MSLAEIDIDEDLLARVMASAKVRTEQEAVNLALRFFAELQARAVCIDRHFERAQRWGAVVDAAQLHEAEKNSRTRSRAGEGACP